MKVVSELARRVFLSTLPLCFLVLPSLIAHATRADDAAASESTEYRSTIDAALEEYRVGHFEEARGLFEHAHAIDPSARTLRGLGMVEFELRHYVRASTLLEAALADARKPLPASQRATVEELLARTRHFVARYTLEIVPDCADVAIELDGAPVELGRERRITVSAGEHKLTVIAAGHHPREQRLDAQGGEQRTLRIVLRAQERTPAVTIAEPPLVRGQNGRRAAGIALSTVGASALAAGAVLGALALKKAEDAPASRGPEADGAKALALGGDVALAVGAVCVVTGVILLIRYKLQQRGSDQRGAVRDGSHGPLRVMF